MLTTDQARMMVLAAEANATAIGMPVNIALLDAGAHLTAFSRMDGAVLGSIDLATGRARTAALFATTSEAVWDYCKPGASAHNLEFSNGGLMPFAGGIPLRSSDGTMVGAIGASGGAVEQDLAIAEAGVAALAN